VQIERHKMSLKYLLAGGYTMFTVSEMINTELYTLKPDASLQKRGF
jgi:hypothetical protein